MTVRGLYRKKAAAKIFPKPECHAIEFSGLPLPRRPGVRALTATQNPEKPQPWGEIWRDKAKKFGIIEKSFFRLVTP
jgi:hypothetical protein